VADLFFEPFAWLARKAGLLCHAHAVWRTLSVTASAAGLLALGGCSGAAEDKVTEVTDVIVNTAASTRGQAQFVSSGVQISSPLSCDTQPSADDFTISCTGTSSEGKKLSMTGTATSMPGGTSLVGSFVGSADGQQVFSTECLGSC
jgi:hypothetical protein